MENIDFEYNGLNVLNDIYKRSEYEKLKNKIDNLSLSYSERQKAINEINKYEKDVILYDMLTQSQDAQPPIKGKTKVYIQEVWAKRGDDYKFYFLGIDEFEFDWYFDKATKALFDFPKKNNVVRVIQYKAQNQDDALELYEQQQKNGGVNKDYFATFLV